MARRPLAKAGLEVSLTALSWLSSQYNLTQTAGFGAEHSPQSVANQTQAPHVVEGLAKLRRNKQNQLSAAFPPTPNQTI